jgi:hypothetical protein
VTGDHLPQRTIALGGTVLQRLRALFAQYDIAGFLELFDRENFRRRQPSGKRDDIRLFGQFEQLADDGTAHAGCTVGVTVFPGCMVHSSSLSDF